MTTHTPGPWTAKANARGWSIEGPGIPCWLICNTESNEPRDSINACLIAAAPDLLVACKAITGVFEGYEDVPLYVSKARAAIAKAEGTRS